MTGAIVAATTANEYTIPNKGINLFIKDIIVNDNINPLSCITFDCFPYTVKGWSLRPPELQDGIYYLSDEIKIKTDSRVFPWASEEQMRDINLPNSNGDGEDNYEIYRALYQDLYNAININLSNIIINNSHGIKISGSGRDEYFNRKHKKKVVETTVEAETTVEVETTVEAEEAASTR